MTMEFAHLPVASKDAQEPCPWNCTYQCQLLLPPLPLSLWALCMDQLLLDAWTRT